MGVQANIEGCYGGPREKVTYHQETANRSDRARRGPNQEYAVVPR